MWAGAGILPSWTTFFCPKLLIRPKVCISRPPGPVTFARAKVGKGEKGARVWGGLAPINSLHQQTARARDFCGSKSWKGRKGRRGLGRHSPTYGGIAQLVEHLLCKQGVRSSNLLISTKQKFRLSGRIFCFVEMAPHSRRLSSNPAASQLPPGACRFRYRSIGCLPVVASLLPYGTAADAALGPSASKARRRRAGMWTAVGRTNPDGE